MHNLLKTEFDCHEVTPRARTFSHLTDFLFVLVRLVAVQVAQVKFIKSTILIKMGGMVSLSNGL